MKANVSHEARGRLHEIKSPTLIMVGRHDELTPPRMAEELKTEMPQARLLVFGEGGHGLYWQAPDLFNQAVLDFLNAQD